MQKESKQKDLLRLLRDPNLLPSEKQTLLSDIAAQAVELDMPCYLVGGFVRDLLLNKPINDFDVVVEGDAIKFGDALVKKHGGKLTTHQKFHTAIWHLPSSFSLHPSSLDLITARKEIYKSPGALPIVTPSTIEDDLRRRDFTVNAMALRIDGDNFGQLLDPLNGQADLEEKTIRVLHPHSFIDDPTRIFRALRYEARYSFILHLSTSILINPESLAVLSKLSGERIHHELDLIFDEDQAIQILNRITELGISKAIHISLPEFNPQYEDFLEMDTSLHIPADHRTMGYMLWFINLSEDEVFSIANRLDFSNELTLAVWSAAQLKRSLPYLKGSKPSEWVYALEKLPLISIYAVYLISGEKALLDYTSFWQHVKQRTTGDELKARGLPPGPLFGEILIQLRAAWLDGVVESAEQESDLLDRLIKLNR